MGYQVVKQPDGLLAIVSSGTDTIVMWDAERSDIVDWFVDIEAKRARESAERTVDAVLDGRPRDVYAQFALTWNEAVEMDREHQGAFSTGEGVGE